MARGKIKSGREVRIRLSQRMLELLSDFLARIMEHSLKKAFARATEILRYSLFSCLSTYASTSSTRTRTRYTCSLLFPRDFSFVLSNKNSKLFADERGYASRIGNGDRKGSRTRGNRQKTKERVCRERPKARNNTRNFNWRLR